jgi:hypothetical protein
MALGARQRLTLREAKADGRTGLEAGIGLQMAEQGPLEQTVANGGDRNNAFAAGRFWHRRNSEFAETVSACADVCSHFGDVFR